MERLNKWAPRGTSQEKAEAAGIFYRLHFKRELVAEGTARRMALYTDAKKLKKDLNRLIEEDTYVSNVYKVDLSDGTSYDEALRTLKNIESIYDEDALKLTVEI